MKRKYISFLITTILLLSCERMLEVNFSDEKPLIVMNGVVEPDKPISVAVSKSFLFTDTDSTAPYLKDVSVELHVNDTFVEKLQRFTIDTAKYRARRGNSYFRSESHVKVGDRVKIKASAPGLETAWVETVIPTPAAIEKVIRQRFSYRQQATIRSDSTGIHTASIPGIQTADGGTADIIFQFRKYFTSRFIGGCACILGFENKKTMWHIIFF